MFKKIQPLFRENLIFSFLVIYRWATLLPALLILNFGNRSEQILPPILVFGVAFLANLAIFLVNHQLNKLVISRPALLSVDLIFSAGILAISGGAKSPYYLYALSPLLAGAFFFQMRGALTIASIFTPLYLLSNYFGAQTLNIQTGLCRIDAAGEIEGDEVEAASCEGLHVVPDGE